MTIEQRGLAEANEAKLKGNELFGNGEYEEALMQYDVALQVAPPPDMPSSVELRSICHSNRAVCFFKLVCTLSCSRQLPFKSCYMSFFVFLFKT